MGKNEKPAGCVADAPPLIYYKINSCKYFSPVLEAGIYDNDWNGGEEGADK